MRFSLTIPVLAMTAGAVANVITETVTAYTTYCPEATSVTYGSESYTISSAGYLTLTNGPYTVTRPMIVETVTQCNQCSSTPVISASASSTPLIPTGVAAASTPLVVASGSGSSATGAGAASATATPVFNAGAMNAATGAGAGLAAVFGIVALML